MKLAWQTWVVLALATANLAVTSMLANAEQLGLSEQPWLTIVVLPAFAFIVVGAANQLKAVGSDTPPAPPKQPEKPPQ